MIVSEATMGSNAHAEAPRASGVCWPGPRSNDSAAEVARALGHPVRIEIVQCIAAHGPLLSGDIVAGSGLAQSTVSEHLRILRDAGIVGVKRDGQRVWNHLLPTGVPEAIDALHDIAKQCSLQGS
jgi:ArsR family transcriptional regulator